MTRFLNQIRRFSPNRSFRITKTGIIFIGLAILVGLAAINSGNNLLHIIFATMMGFIIVSGVFSERCLRGIQIERDVPEYIFAEEEATVRLILRKRKAKFPSFSLKIEDRVSGRGRIYAGYCISLFPEEKREVEYRCVFPERGLHRFEEVRISTEFPFGFFAKSMRVRVTQEVIVYPKIEVIGLAELEEALHGNEISTRKAGQGGEFYGLRRYSFYDDAKLIHWKTSAHSLQLMAIQFEREETRKVSLILNTNSFFGKPSQNFETAVKLIASLASHLCGLEFQVELIADTKYIPLGIGRKHLFSMLRELALLEISEQPSEETKSFSLIEDHADSLRLLVASDKKFWGETIGDSFDVVLGPEDLARLIRDRKS